MKVLSLFDGISCGMVALERAGIPVERYVAYEIDKNAIKVSKKNYPQIEHRGDVVGADFTEFEGFDLLIGGSPCQGFSSAGKMLNFDDPRSKLFFEYVRALNEVKPKYFLLENVKMKKEYLDTITNYVGVEPILINSALVSAQNRERYYWSNIPNISQPEDKHIHINDILANGAYGLNCTNEKAKTLIAGYARQSINNITGYVGFGSSGAYEPICGAFRGGLENSGDRDRFQRLEPRADYKSNTITSVQKDNVIIEPCDIMNRYDDKNVFRVENGWTTVHGRTYQIKLPDGCYVFRRFTPVECERLQTLPDDYTDGVANTHRYKQCGNGWTVDVIAHIFKGLKEGQD